MRKDDPIKDALATARHNLMSRISQRLNLTEEAQRLDKEIDDWKRVVDSLSTVSGETSAELPADILVFDRAASLAGVATPLAEPYKAMRFTDAIRETLREAGVVLSPPQIRDHLKIMGFDFSKYAQELVPVHNTLKRLAEQGEVRVFTNADGDTVGYMWIDPVLQAVEKERSNWLTNTKGILDAALGQEAKTVPLQDLLKPMAPRTRFPKVNPPPKFSVKQKEDK